MLFAYILITAIVAAAIAYLLADRRGRTLALEAQTRAVIADGRANDLATRNAALEAQLRTVDVERMKVESARASIEAKLVAERDKLVAQQRFVEQAEQRLKDAFATLSIESLQQGGKQFLALASERFNELATRAAGSLEQKRLEMANLLQPVNDTLARYKADLDKVERSRVEAYSSVNAKLAEVATTQQLLGGVTQQLSNALRKSEVRGQWGEMTLRRLLEMSGLAQRVNFHEQVTVAGDDGARQRPDCVVQLPNDRQVLIDCKAVLDAFLDGANCADDVSRGECFRRHAKQVRSRVDELSRKAYWHAFGDSADYVVLFLPGEAFLYAAVEHDGKLIEDALANKVIIASPTTLLGLLKVIEYGWEKKDVERNADAIREIGVELHKRVAVLAAHFGRLGGALESALGAYNETLGSMERAVLPQVRRMAELGAVSNKDVPVLEVLPTHARDMGKTWAQLPKPIEEPAST